MLDRDVVNTLFSTECSVMISMLEMSLRSCLIIRRTYIDCGPAHCAVLFVQNGFVACAGVLVFSYLLTASFF